MLTRTTYYILARAAHPHPRTYGKIQEETIKVFFFFLFLWVSFFFLLLFGTHSVLALSVCLMIRINSYNIFFLRCSHMTWWLHKNARAFTVHTSNFFCFISAEHSVNAVKMKQFRVGIFEQHSLRGCSVYIFGFAFIFIII